MEKGSLSTEFLQINHIQFSHQNVLNTWDGQVKYKLPLYKAGETFVTVYQALNAVFNFIKRWDCWVDATANSLLPFKYSQSCLFWQTSANKEPSGLLQGSPWAVRECSMETPCSLGITQGKGMAATPAKGSAWGNQPCWCCGRATSVTGSTSLSWSCSYNLPVLSWKY